MCCRERAALRWSPVFSGRVGLFGANLMERSPMTDNMMNLRSLVEKSADADLLREMIAAAEKLMALEIPARRPARAMARRMASDWPSVAAIAIETGGHGRAPSSCAFPKLRTGSYFPSFLEPRRMAEKALTTCPGGLYPGRLDPLSRPSGQGHGHVGHLQEPGIPAVQRSTTR